MSGCTSRPFSDLSTSQTIIYVINGGRLPRPPKQQCHTGLYRLMQACWSQDPDCRPTAACLVEKLAELVSQTSRQKVENESLAATLAAAASVAPPVGLLRVPAGRVRNPSGGSTGSRLSAALRHVFGSSTNVTPALKNGAKDKKSSRDSKDASSASENSLIA